MKGKRKIRRKRKKIRKRKIRKKKNKKKKNQEKWEGHTEFTYVPKTGFL